MMLVLIFAASCKSKKNATHSGKKEKTSRKEYKALSEKLNLDVTKDDNIKLYTFVAEWLGTPHQMGKCTKSGVDCSCFVVLLYDKIYQQKLPRTAAEMHKQSSSVSKRNLNEGNLVFFKIKSRKVSHVGVYLKDGWFAHVSTSKGVMINNLSEKYYEQYYDGGGRL